MDSLTSTRMNTNTISTCVLNWQNNVFDCFGISIARRKAPIQIYKTSLFTGFNAKQLFRFHGYNITILLNCFIIRPLVAYKFDNEFYATVLKYQTSFKILNNLKIQYSCPSFLFTSPRFVITNHFPQWTLINSYGILNWIQKNKTVK